jgi:hypothetical protein
MVVVITTIQEYALLSLRYRKVLLLTFVLSFLFLTSCSGGKSLNSAVKTKVSPTDQPSSAPSKSPSQRNDPRPPDWLNLPKKMPDGIGMTPDASGWCDHDVPIRGKLTKKGNKVYFDFMAHDDVVATECFKTTDDAVKAGYHAMQPHERKEALVPKIPQGEPLW